MKIKTTPISNTKVLSVNPSGYASAPTISRAWNVTALAQDFELTEEKTGNQIPFFIVPLTEGTITVGLADDSGTPHVISAAEIKAFLGQPMLYLIKKVYKTGTTVSSFNIGI